MSVRLRNGQWLLVNGTVATAQPCCCEKCVGSCPGGASECATGCGCSEGECVECSGPCDEENPCPEGCKCCDGECVPEDTCCGPCVSCEGSCQWTNDPDFDAQPPVNGWYLIFGCDDEETCECADPEGQAPPYDFEDPEGSLETTTSPCVVRNEEDACPEGCVCVDGECVEECEFVGCRIYYSSGTSSDYEFNFWNGILSEDPFEDSSEPTCNWWGEGEFLAAALVTGSEEPEFDPNETVCGAEELPQTSPGTFTGAALYVIDAECCATFRPPYRGEGTESDPTVPMPFIEVDCEEFAEFEPNLPICSLPP